mmetsp:Transcript_191/g.419  ORF Transcript_191/g.419 Transcript_191/m.419 type:complete len:554 (-) Transcript_191:331-1992(-)|eukprot:CAMPEP_0175124606 /NCGR_PEP_ID=MMETSP0087-20121206/2870_1 /TAXON_ID=136419 /ORGANISM="Unknown Unknown, Strain D1" /LENGTH=553 /DNA_ID=CAMNT_0016406383 /DNA_START=64 /DNA_END=1725 /DNA_ORIENTATION=+
MPSKKVHQINLDDIEGTTVEVGGGVEGGKAKMASKKKKRKRNELVAAMQKYKRDGDEKKSEKGIKNRKLRTAIKQTDKQAQQSIEEAAKAEILLPSEAGFLEAEKMERTWRFSQDQLKEFVDDRSAKKMFSLDLDQFGPYCFDYTRNGRHMALAGRKGHVATLELQKFKLGHEMHLRETIRDVCFLHDETMLAVAQKKYVYIYDSSGLELHCLRTHIDPNTIMFLPYHFLLASVGKTGYLKYTDTSTGAFVAEHRTKLGECKVMVQNPRNAIACLGHNNGTVTMWSPNVTTPHVKMLCHRAPVLAMAVDNMGQYMVTSGLDGQVKVWDLRTYKELHSYFTVRPSSTVSVSQTGLLALGHGSHVQVWKDAFVSKQKAPYMVEQLPGKSVQKVCFCPYEDVLAVGHSQGLTSLVIPGAGEANFDTFEANPFQTTKQRREKTVVSLLEKLQPEMITMNPNMFGLLDTDSKTLLQGERAAMREARLEEEKTKEVKNKARGGNRSSKRWRRKRKNIVDDAFEKRKEKIKLAENLRLKDKKARARAAEGKPTSALDRFI